MNGNYMAGDTSRPASVLNLLAGIWLVISPWALRFAGLPAATWDNVIVGIAVVLLAAIRLGTSWSQPLSWINCALGAWAFIAPFVLQFSDYQTPLWNNLITGALVFLFGLWGALGTTTTTRPFTR